MITNLLQESVSVITHHRKPKRPYLLARILEIPTKVLYDTGADICCLSEQIFTQLKAKLPIQSSNYQKQFKSAGGQRLQVIGKYSVPLKIGKKEVRHPFFVIRNLNEPAILGIDFIEQHGLHYNPSRRTFKWKTDTANAWETGTLKVQACQVIPPFTVMAIKTKVMSDDGGRLNTEADGVGQIVVDNQPLLQGGPDLIKINEHGIASIFVHNCSPSEVTLARDDVIGFIDRVEDSDLQQLRPEFVASVAKAREEPSSLPPEKKKFILEKMNVDVPAPFKERFVKLLLKHHDVFSRDKYDLGRAKTLMHEIALKSEEPVYIKQFKIPDAHREEVEKHVAEWLKLGVIQPTRSKFNCPIFVVAKKNGGLRIVQDFRGLNENTMTDKYSMKDVSECIGEIGRSNSTIFSTLDMTAGFWQMLLHPKSRPYTAFTLPGKGQFQWVTSPMGLLGCPASFQRLMETVVADLSNIIVYIDDLLAHSSSYEEHLLLLDQLFFRLRDHGLKVNLEKCYFGCKKVAYLGFQLTEEGIKPGSDKLKTVAAAQPPSNVHEIRQFLGLCNFFRTHVRNFAQISAPLTALTRKDSAWKSGPLPDDACKAFRELQSSLTSEPVVDYPRRNRPYALITDAALGDDKTPGGLGAILTQVDEAGEYRVIAYASRKLQTHEKNYTPFLLEMQAAIWGMDHFSSYLRGRHFTLFTDHKPLEKLGKVHTRTLNRLQEVMNTYDFEIIYKKGSEMPADFLSRHAINAISWESTALKDEQDRDPLIKALKQFLLHRELPADPKHQQLVRHFSQNCFIEDEMVWVRIQRYQAPSRVVLFLPQTMVHSAISEAHGQHLTGHDGTFKTKERLLQCYYWPGMDKDITDHIKACHKCQLRKNAHRPPIALLTPLPQPTELNMRIHADLHGPLRTSGNMKRYILVITDAFTKYVELVAIDNKEAPTVTEAIFKKWICRYGVPLEIITDQGKEFCNKLSDELYKLLGTEHHTTSSRHPACNAQVEVCNKTIAKYLSSVVDETTLDWELYLAPLMFSYNTSFHRSILNTPFFLTYGQEPRTPSFPTPDIRRKFYGESTSAELHQSMLYARDLARQHNEAASEKFKQNHDKKAAPHNYQVNQLVLLDEHSFLHKNTKLAPKWSGPHRIIKVKNDTNVELLLKNKKHLIVHVNRLKPYIVPYTPDFAENRNPKELQHQTSELEQETQETETQDRQDRSPSRARSRTHSRSVSRPHSRARTPSLQRLLADSQIQLFPSTASRSSSPASRAATPPPVPATPAKRGRGRPRKTALEAPARSPSPPVPPSPVAKRGRGRPRKTPSLTHPPPIQENFEPPATEQNADEQNDQILHIVSSSNPQKGGGKSEYEQAHESYMDDNYDTEDEQVWTLVKHKQQRKQGNKPRWTKGQRRNYTLYGDIYNEPPFKAYQSHQHSYQELIPVDLQPHEDPNPPPPPNQGGNPINPNPPIPPNDQGNNGPPIQPLIQPPGIFRGRTPRTFDRDPYPRRRRTSGPTISGTPQHKDRTPHRTRSFESTDTPSTQNRSGNPKAEPVEAKGFSLIDPSTWTQLLQPTRPTVPLRPPRKSDPTGYTGYRDLREPDSDSETDNTRASDNTRGIPSRSLDETHLLDTSHRPTGTVPKGRTNQPILRPSQLRVLPRDDPDIQPRTVQPSVRKNLSLGVDDKLHQQSQLPVPQLGLQRQHGVRLDVQHGRRLPPPSGAVQPHWPHKEPSTLEVLDQLLFSGPLTRSASARTGILPTSPPNPFENKKKKKKKDE